MCKYISYEAQKAMDKLGMKESLNDCWKNSTVSGDMSLNMNDYEDEEDKEEALLLTDNNGAGRSV